MRALCFVEFMKGTDMSRIAAILIFGAAASSSAAHAASVVVKVTDVASAKGQVMVSLCDQSSFGKGRCPIFTKFQPRRGTVSVRFDKVPDGQWAAAVYHDENGNGILDRNGLGIPTEGG